MRAYNGMSAVELADVAWRKASASGPNGGNCVELARLPGTAGIAMRNSRDPRGPVLVYTLDEVAAFLDGAREGEFDGLLR